ncbi:MAG: acetolactate synthase large subunit [Pseudomonadota bacterium]
MNGAESLVRTLLASNVDVCFANPGTSEMHFVAALDRVDGMRCVLGLFEGVVTGAADGYARMADKPASTLLHLGPGLGNAAANLHNAKKASTPMVNIIGEHATYHIEHDAPLTADIEGMAWPVSHWVKTSRDARSVAADGADAVAAARAHPGQIACLILPANTAWDEGTGPAPVVGVPERPQIGEDALRNAVAVLRSGEPTAIVLTGLALRERGLELAGKISAATGAKIIAQGSNSRTQRGAGRYAVNRVPFPVDQALEVLKPYQHVILVGAKPPVAFFAYPGKPSVLTPEGCQIHRLSELHEDGVHALEWLADEVDANSATAAVQQAFRPDLPSGALTKDSIAAVLGALLPENAIVADESVTTGRGFFTLTAGAPPHDWLNNMGGSIGLGMPLATGAALACPDRKTVCLSGDGSGMYTLQALWTQAREGLNVTTVVFANRDYEILKGELGRVGASNPGPKALDMLTLDRPVLDWVQMANGMGVEATRVESAEAFAKALSAGLDVEGPYLIEVVV